MKYLQLLLLISFVFLLSCGSVNTHNSISNSNFSLIWETPISPKGGDHIPQGIVIDKLGRDYLYVSEKANGISVYKKSTGEKITNIGIDNFKNLHAMHIKQQGNYLYIALGNFFGGKSKAGLAIIDATNPEKLTTTDYWISKNVIKGSAIAIADGNFAYLGAMNQGIYVFDVTDERNIIETDHYIPDPNSPTLNPSKIQEPNARGMDIKGNDLFVCYDAGGIRVIDVTDKSNVFEKSRYINDSFNKQKAYNNILINGNYAYVAVDYCGMEVLDISNPKNIFRSSWCNPWNCETNNNTWFNSGGHTNQIRLNTTTNKVYLSAGGSEIVVIDVTHPDNCKYLESYGTRKNKQAVWGLDVENNTIYATYITSIIPFPGRWKGIKCLEYKP